MSQHYPGCNCCDSQPFLMQPVVPNTASKRTLFVPVISQGCSSAFFHSMQFAPARPKRACCLQPTTSGAPCMVQRILIKTVKNGSNLSHVPCVHTHTQTPTYHTPVNVTLSSAASRDQPIMVGGMNHLLWLLCKHKNRCLSGPAILC